MPLQNGIVFCVVESWLTGSRLVSLPFSDYCEPLVDTRAEQNILLRHARTFLDTGEMKYLELRPRTSGFANAALESGYSSTSEFFVHKLDLQPELDSIYRSLDKDSIQRRIQRANRAELAERCGNSEDLLQDFYALFVETRKRQQVPPAPYKWFHSLIATNQESLEIRVAYKAQIPIASILTLQFKDVVHYKYGCSDVRFNNLGATPWLFWKAITASKARGATTFDFGRTELDNPGLLAFKNHWVPVPERLCYWRYPNIPPISAHENWESRFAKKVFSLMPKNALALLGKLLYPHIG
jgi:lipid II:glycine glycyltransferase (peptidoglycan interpeptide bridge formation enzyme)